MENEKRNYRPLVNTIDGHDLNKICVIVKKDKSIFTCCIQDEYVDKFVVSDLSQVTIIKAYKSDTDAMISDITEVEIYIDDIFIIITHSELMSVFKKKELIKYYNTKKKK